MQEAQRDPVPLHAAEPQVGERGPAANPPAAQPIPLPIEVLRCVRPRYIPKNEFEKRLQVDAKIKCLTKEREAILKGPNPPSELERAAWRKVQEALLEWIPLFYAPAYRRLKVMAVDVKMKAQAIKIHERMQKQEIGRWRNNSGVRLLPAAQKFAARSKK